MDFVFVVFSAYCSKLVHTTVNSTQKGLRSFFLHFVNIYYCKFDKHLRHKKNQSKDLFIYLFHVPLSLKNKLWHRCFPVSFAKFSITSFSQNTSGRLLLDISNLPWVRNTIVILFIQAALWTMFTFFVTVLEFFYPLK